MTQEASLEQSYLTLIKFLMLSKRRLIEVGSEHGLTGMQALMVFLLDTPRSMGDFKHIFNCDASNVTGLVDGLEQKKLASRYEDPQDRRLKMVRLDSKGTKVRRRLISDLTDRRSPLLAKLTKDELKTFVQLLEKITIGVPHV